MVSSHRCSPSARQVDSTWFVEQAAPYSTRQPVHVHDMRAEREEDYADVLALLKESGYSDRAGRSSYS